MNTTDQKKEKENEEKKVLEEDDDDFEEFEDSDWDETNKEQIDVKLWYINIYIPGRKTGTTKTPMMSSPNNSDRKYHDILYL